VVQTIIVSGPLSGGQISIKRAEMKIGLANLVYNIRRFLYLERINAA